jgi:O-methyltransferase involved in polyketide biosynthesis
MNPKSKITLTKEQETLFIPLYAKAMPNPILVDPSAQQILNSIAYDFARLKVPEKTAVTLRIRASQLDTYARRFIAAHPNATILHIGCGLDSRCARVPHPEGRWFDLDLPDVIALRREFFQESQSYRMIASSAADLSWLDHIPADGSPVLTIAEGLLMYLTEPEVRALVLRLHERFPGSELAFDAFSRYTTERIQAHPSLRKTGAAIHWGIDDPHEIEDWAEGIHLVEEWFFSQSPDVSRLSLFYRIMFRLTRSIQVAQRAQRLLYFRL